MTTSNAATVQTIVNLIDAGINNTTIASNNSLLVSQQVKSLADSTQAAVLVKDVMVQAILQGLANVTTRTDDKGKQVKNDRASNWRRNLATAYNRAYPSDTTRLSLSTSGKGSARTVTVEIKEVAEKSELEKITAKLASILDSCNATENERSSLTARVVKLYDKERARQADEVNAARAARETAEQLAAHALQIKASEYLTSRGMAVTDNNIAIVAPLLSMAG